MNTIKHKWFLIGMFLAGMLLVSCSSLANAQNNEAGSSEPSQVIVQEVTPGPEPTPVKCTPSTDEVTVQIEFTSSDKVQITVTGLQPGENIVVVYERNLPEDDWRRENGQTIYTPTAPIGEDGTFEDSLSLSRFDPEEGVRPNEWVVKVIHEYGVTCMSFIPPTE